MRPAVTPAVTRCRIKHIFPEIGHGPENSHKRICLKEEVLFAEILSLAVPPKTVCVCKYQHALGRAQKPMAFCSLLSMRKQHGRYQCCSLFVSGGKNLRNTHGFGTPYTIIFDPGAAPATGQGEKKPLKYKRARESC